MPSLCVTRHESSHEPSDPWDKILSENYLQHADHFTRILNERESYRKEKNLREKPEYDLETTKQSLDENTSEKNLDDNLVKETNTENPATK